MFFVIAHGYLAGRMRDIDGHHVVEPNALVMDFALPASLPGSTRMLHRPRRSRNEWVQAIAEIRNHPGDLTLRLNNAEARANRAASIEVRRRLAVQWDAS